MYKLLPIDFCPKRNWRQAHIFLRKRSVTQGDCPSKIAHTSFNSLTYESNQLWTLCCDVIDRQKALSSLAFFRRVDLCEYYPNKEFQCNVPRLVPATKSRKTSWNWAKQVTMFRVVLYQNRCWLIPCDFGDIWPFSYPTIKYLPRHTDSTLLFVEYHKCVRLDFQRSIKSNLVKSVQDRLDFTNSKPLSKTCKCPHFLLTKSAFWVWSDLK